MPTSYCQQLLCIAVVLMQTSVTAGSRFPTTKHNTPGWLVWRGGGDDDAGDTTYVHPIQQSSTSIFNNNIQSSSDTALSSPQGPPPAHQLLEETILHDGWRRLINRKVRLPVSGKVADFEIVAQRGTDQAVLVFVWHSLTKTATCIREYMPSVHHHMLGLAAGMVEAKKHSSSMSSSSSNDDGTDASDNDDDEEQDACWMAAKCELEEECRLTGGTQWIRLTENAVVMDKYNTTRLITGQTPG